MSERTYTEDTRSKIHSKIHPYNEDTRRRYTPKIHIGNYKTLSVTRSPRLGLSAHIVRCGGDKRGRGDGTASAACTNSCTVFLMTPPTHPPHPLEHTSEGGRDGRGGSPVPRAESTLELALKGGGYNSETAKVLDDGFSWYAPP